MAIIGKTDRITAEIPRLHWLAQLVLYKAAAFMKNQFNRDIVVTCIVRTIAENQAAGGATYSGHLFGRAFDLRSCDLTASQIEALVRYLNQEFGDIIYIETKLHGTAPHIHINIRAQYAPLES